MCFITYSQALFNIYEILWCVARKDFYRMENKKLRADGTCLNNKLYHKKRFYVYKY